jgi:hypothetical protein
MISSFSEIIIFLLFLELHLPIDIRVLRPIVISFLLKEESTITTKTTTTTTTTTIIITSSLILGIRTVQEISAFTLEHFRRPLHHLLPRELHGNGGGNSVTFLSTFSLSFKPNSSKNIMNVAVIYKEAIEFISKWTF